MRTLGHIPTINTKFSFNFIKPRIMLVLKMITAGEGIENTV